MQEKKERFHGIPMLPYGLLSAVMQESPGNRKEIQITENGRGRILLSNRECYLQPTETGSLFL